MRRSVVVGIVCFVLGSAVSPRAANKDETLTLLCKRYEELGGRTFRNSVWPQRDHAIQFLGSVLCEK